MGEALGASLQLGIDAVRTVICDERFDNRFRAPDVAGVLSHVDRDHKN